ncbi:MAG: putative 4-hydroxybenzoate polyprenyltransferase [Verrucomicrobia bacterium]|nr:putative 4-hydroxybenzoate polyprenyltransferase [Verrucomicrobiota bacterium]
MHILKRIAAYISKLAEFIKFSHTVFALPFALVSMAVAAGGMPQLRVFGWILFCMVAARTAAMSFNRLVDWEIDKENPRTFQRHTLIQKSHGWILCLFAAGGALFGTWMLNGLCFALSPAMLALIFFYSLTKRFTAFPHFFLGLALSVAPMGAWAAVTGTLLTPTPYFLAAAVLCWSFGFDLIYATMDVEFDRKKGLFSFPARYGVPAALRLARGLHAGAAVGFALFGWSAHLGALYWIALAVVVVVLFLEQKIAQRADMASVNQAFFNANAVVSGALLLGVCLDLWLR